MPWKRCRQTKKTTTIVIIDVLQKGYMLNDKVVRPAQVKIGQYKDQNTERTV